MLSDTKLLAGVAIQTSPAGLPLLPSSLFSYCQGILIDKSITSLPAHRRCVKVTSILDKMAHGLTERYNFFELGLHWSLDDLRALQWFNHHMPDRGGFVFDLKYTGIINLEMINSKEHLVSSFGKGRRYDIKLAKKQNIEIQSVIDSNILENLHRLTFQRQGASRGIYEHSLVPIVTNALTHNYGEVIVAFLPDKRPISAALFVWGNKTAHYLFGATDPDFRNTGAASLVIAESIWEAKKRSFKTIDLVGINSPERGSFKTSFSATPVPYFHARWNKPDQ